MERETVYQTGGGARKVSQVDWGGKKQRTVSVE